MIDQSIETTDPRTGGAPLQFRPTVVIGLGGAGKKTVARFKRMLRSTYGTTDIPVLRWLAIDTDAGFIPKREEDPLQRGEQFVVPAFDSRDVIGNENYPGLMDWWDDSLDHVLAQSPNVGGTGAGMLRRLGRLALFFSVQGQSSLLQSLRRECQIAVSNQSRTAVREMQLLGQRCDVPPEAGLQVYIVCSVCGGTGAGMFLDLGFLVRHVAGRDTTNTAMLMLPDVIMPEIKPLTPFVETLLQANAYGCLVELERCARVEPGRQQNYCGQLVDLSQTPFNRQFLFSLNNLNNVPLNSEDDVAELIASLIYLESATQLGDSTRSVVDNWVKQGNIGSASNARPRIFGGLGCTTWVLQAERILDYCEQRLAREMIESVLLAPGEAATAGPTAAGGLLSQSGLRRADLLATLKDKKALERSFAEEIKAGRGDGRQAPDRARALQALGDQAAADDENLEARRLTIQAEAAPLRTGALEALSCQVARVLATQGLAAARTMLETLVKTVDEGVPFETVQDRPSIAAQRYCLLKANYIDATKLEANKQVRDDAVARVGTASQRFGKDARVVRQAIDEAVPWVDGYPDDALNAYAQAEALKTYDELLVRADQYLTDLKTVARALEQTVGQLERQEARVGAAPAGAVASNELARDVASPAWITAFYERYRPPQLSGQLLSSGIGSLDTVETWTAADEKTLEAALRQGARAPFRAELARRSVLDVVEEDAGSAEAVAARFEAMVEGASCYLPYNATRLGALGAPNRHLAIGMLAATDRRIPAEYASEGGGKYSVATTGRRDRLDVVEQHYGIPLNIIDPFSDLENEHRKFSRENPINVFVLPRPEEEAEARRRLAERQRLFALAVAYDYIKQVGTYYYFDPLKEYGPGGRPPQAERRLSEEPGRAQAAGGFTSKEEWVARTRQLVDQVMARDGSGQTVAFVKGHLQREIEPKEDQATRPELKAQYRVERIRLYELLRDLGESVPPERLDLAEDPATAAR